MGEDYWAPVFAKLLENIDFLRLLCHDTADADLLNWVLPNRPLALRCASFIRKHKITDREALINEVIDFAESDQALRKIILFTWVEKNPKTMGFVSTPANPDNIARLNAGQFGKPSKINILARIDPRSGSEKIYQQYCQEHPEPELKGTVSSTAPAPTPAQDIELRLRETTDMATRAVKRSRELESAIENVKSDNRQLKKELESREKEVSVLSRKLEENVTHLKSAETKVDELERQAGSMRLQIKNLESAKLQQPATSVDNSYEISELKESCTSMQSQIDGLQKALQNRDSSISRLESDKAELQKKISAEADQQRRIDNLQSSLKVLTSEQTAAAKLTAGQLVTRVTSDKKNSDWLFLSVTGQTLQVPAETVKAAGIIPEEFALLSLNDQNEPTRIISLDIGNRREICGFLKSDPDGLWLVADGEERLPVFLTGEADKIDKPVRGIFLNEAGNREAGIYHIELLKTSEQKTFEVLTASAKQLRSFFNADLLDFDQFCKELSNLSVNFKLEKDQHIKFSRDYRQVLNGLRPSLPVTIYCAAAACIERAKMATMARSCQPGQSCSYCGGFPVSEGSADNFQFNNERILIFGGDRIGSEYERILARHNLLVTWHSGFKNMHELRTGLGKTDAVVVIVRQISHTLLREIVPVAEKEHIPLIYCTRRGVSGVLSHLLDHFHSPGNAK